MSPATLDQLPAQYWVFIGFGIFLALIALFLFYRKKYALGVTTISLAFIAVFFGVFGDNMKKGNIEITREGIKVDYERIQAQVEAQSEINLVDEKFVFAKETPKAIKDLEQKAENRDPNQRIPEDNLLLAIKSLRKENPGEALKFIKAGLDMNPQDDKTKASLYRIRGAIHGQQKKYDDAIQDFNESIKLNKDSYSSRYNFGVVLQAKGNIRKAIKEYETAKTLKADSIPVLQNLGILYDKQSKYELSKKQFNKVIEISPQNSMAKAKLVELNKKIISRNENKTPEPSVTFEPRVRVPQKNWGTTEKPTIQGNELIDKFDRPFTLKHFEKSDAR